MDIEDTATYSEVGDTQAEEPRFGEHEGSSSSVNTFLLRVDITSRSHFTLPLISRSSTSHNTNYSFLVPISSVCST